MKDTFKSSISDKKFVNPIMSSYGFPDVATLHPEVDNNGIKMALALVEDQIARVLIAKSTNYDENKFIEYMQEFNSKQGISNILPIRDLVLPYTISGIVEFREDVLPHCSEMFDISSDRPIRSARQLGGYAGFVFAVEFYCFMSDYYQHPNTD